jgi:alkylation response protein AidB-like acyl-CoA dehydrogenase
MEDSLYFNEQHLQVREMVRAFANDHVRPVASQHDADSSFPWENVAKMADLGLFGIPWSEELGGTGFDTTAFIIAIHELAKVCASHSITISAHTTLGTSPIVHFGSDAQKRRYVPLLASGKVLGGFGLTEPNAGSDAGGTQTTAVRKNGHYVLNGTKRFITHAGVGEIFVVTALTDPGAGTRGISSFILTKETTDRPVPSALATTIPSCRCPDSGPGRRKTRWAGVPATHASSSSRTSKFQRKTCLGLKEWASSTS